MIETKEILTQNRYIQNERRKEELKESIKKEADDAGVEFILGAGVSMSVGLPGWDTLLAQAIGRMMYYIGEGTEEEKLEKEAALAYDETLKDEDKKFIKGTKGDYNSALKNANLLEVAEYIRNYEKEINKVRGDEGLLEFRIVSLISECMRDYGKELAIHMLDYPSSTLESVVKVIAEKYNKDEKDKKNDKNEKNKKRLDILTYNYDDLLEICLNEKAGICMEDINSISLSDVAEKKRFKEGKINIAHIHGKISVRDRDDISDNIILSESSYYGMERSEYLWQHVVQADAMLNKICLFVGFSAQDYNFRRIIKNCRDINRTYIIFALDDLVNGMFPGLLKELAHRKVTEYIEACKSSDSDIDIKELDLEGVIKDNKDDFLKEIFDRKNKKYAYERLMLDFHIRAQTMYWEANNIKPIWTTLKELPALITDICS